MRATSYDEVYSGALLGSDQRFEQAVDLAQTGLSDLHEAGDVSGAMVYGSAVSRGIDGRGDYDPLSDIDILAIVPDGDLYRSERILRTLAMAIRNETAVQPELGWLSERDAQLARHNILPTTLTWLGHQAVGHPDMVIGTAPPEMIEPNYEDTLSVVSTWFRVTRSNLLKAGNSADIQVALGLSLPHIAARKSIDALRYHDPDNMLGIPPPQSLNYTRSEVGAMVRFVYGHDRHLQESYEELALIKQGFLGFIETVATGRFVSRQGYAATLDSFANDTVPRASDVLLRMHEQFDAAATHISGNAPLRVAAYRLLPEPAGDNLATSHGVPVNDSGVYHYGLQRISNY